MLNLSETDKKTAFKQALDHAIPIYQSWNSYLSTNLDKTSIELAEIAKVLQTTTENVQLLFEKYQFPTISYTNIGCVNAFFVSLCFYYAGKPQQTLLTPFYFSTHCFLGDPWWPGSLFAAETYDIDVFSQILEIPLSNMLQEKNITVSNGIVTLGDLSSLMTDNKLVNQYIQPKKVSPKWTIYKPVKEWNDVAKKRLLLNIKIISDQTFLTLTY